LGKNKENGNFLSYIHMYLAMVVTMKKKMNDFSTFDYPEPDGRD